MKYRVSYNEEDKNGEWHKKSIDIEADNFEELLEKEKALLKLIGMSAAVVEKIDD